MKLHTYYRSSAARVRIALELNLEQYPTILSIYAHCNTLEAFKKAHPDQQADKPGE